jgi:hypothetical protein
MRLRADAQPVRLERHIIVQNGHPIRPGSFDAPIHGCRETEIASQAKNTGSSALRHLRRIVRGAVVGHDDFIEGKFLRPQAFQSATSNSRRFQCGMTAATVAMRVNSTRIAVYDGVMKRFL